MQKLLYYYFNAEVAERYIGPLMQGFWLTLEMALLIILLGLALGVLLALLRAFQIRPLGWLIIFFSDLFRALPPLVIIVLVYFALPYGGIRLGSFTSTVLSLSLVLAAFAHEIVYAGIASVHRGQWEAARSTGLGFLATLLYVVMPQALRLSVAPLTNRTIAITKGTALGSVIAVQEILNIAGSAQSSAANPTPLMMGACLYLVIFAPMIVASRWIERRFGWSHL
ncbi:MAG: amino acid ABC transporter permease [Alphaproteobacteria bacterium]